MGVLKPECKNEGAPNVFSGLFFWLILPLMKPLVECVPNFSEGRNQTIISQISSSIQQSEGVTLLDVDPGMATNRTVMTFVGAPEDVIEAAFNAIKMASSLIDMSKHTGEHPRMGATDVCPLIPVSGISMKELIPYAQKLAERVGRELNIPVYLYGQAQSDQSRSNLSVIRSGEYEGMFEKIRNPKWKPDHGPAEMNSKSGATAVGIRDFLIAYNVNLNTKSVRHANRVAFDVREAGRVLRKGNQYTGEILRDEKGEPVRQAGACKEVKAIGWYIEEYGIAQISANLTNYHITPIHVFFDEVCKSANSRGLRVTGSELVGLIPLKAMLDAGRHFLKKQERSLGVPDEELIDIAVKSLGLDELTPFDPNKKIIEYAMGALTDEKLVSLSCKQFAEETLRDSAAPGGGSVSALCGSLGASLQGMVANLSAGKRGWEDRWEYFSEWAVKSKELQNHLLYLVDEDTRSFEKVMEAFQLPKNNQEEINQRKMAIQEATLYAAQVPLQVMETSAAIFEICERMMHEGNPNSVTDAAVGGLCAATAVEGAGLNVLINLESLPESDETSQMKNKVRQLQKLAAESRNRILTKMNEQFGR